MSCQCGTRLTAQFTKIGYCSRCSKKNGTYQPKLTNSDGTRDKRYANDGRWDGYVPEVATPKRSFKEEDSPAARGGNRSGLPTPTKLFQDADCHNQQREQQRQLEQRRQREEQEQREKQDRQEREQRQREEQDPLRQREAAKAAAAAAAAVAEAQRKEAERKKRESEERRRQREEEERKQREKQLRREEQERQERELQQQRQREEAAREKARVDSCIAIEMLLSRRRRARWREATLTRQGPRRRTP